MLNINEIKNLKIYAWWDSLLTKKQPLVDKLTTSKFFLRLKLDIYLGKAKPGTDYTIKAYYQYGIGGAHVFVLGPFEKPEDKYTLASLRVLTLHLYVFWLAVLPLFSELFKYYPRYNMSFDHVELNILLSWWAIPEILEEVVQFLLKENISQPFPEDTAFVFESMFYRPFNFVPRVADITAIQEKCIELLGDGIQDSNFMPEEHINMLYFFFTNTGLSADKYKHLSKRDLITLLFKGRYSLRISLLTTQTLLSDWFIDFEKFRQSHEESIKSVNTPEGMTWLLNRDKEILKKEFNLTDLELEILSNPIPPKTSG